MTITDQTPVCDLAVDGGRAFPGIAGSDGGGHFGVETRRFAVFVDVSGESAAIFVTVENPLLASPNRVTIPVRGSCCYCCCCCR